MGTTTNSELRVDGDRLWATIHELAAIGATAAGGVCRLALTDVDLAGRRRFTEWAEAVGCTVSFDAMGNLFARRPGTDPARAPVAVGSHLDSQPTGGKYDGAYGVMVGLEIVRTLHDHGVETAAPIEVISWTNEEGARFPPAMVGSGVFGGAFTLVHGHGQVDPDGLSIGDELARIGYLGEETPGDHPLGAYLEPHIEQGPILEAEERPIGVVRGVQGIRWYDVSVVGQEAHAGSTPMDRRRDALVAASRLVDAADAIARRRDPDGRSTVGVLHVEPASRNTIVGRVSMTLDLRHPDADELVAMDADVRAAAADIATTVGVELDVTEIWYSPPIVFAPECVDAVGRAATDLGLASMPITSGAGHDACYVSAVAPAGMIFVPCADGLSHNEAESLERHHAVAGADVTLRAVLELAS